MSSFSEFSKGHKEDHIGPKVKAKTRVDDMAKNRIDPATGNEREDREPLLRRDLQEANTNPDIKNIR